MKLIKLDCKVKISDLPIALSYTDIRSDLKSCTPGQWAIFQTNKENKESQHYIGYANPFAENNKILRLIKEVKLDELVLNDEDVVKNILEECLAIAFSRREFCKEMLGPCCRMFYGDQDGLPGLIIDKYCNALILQINTAGIDCYEKTITDYLKKYYDLPILYFENSNLRKIESLPSRPRIMSQIEKNLKILEVFDNKVLIKIPIEEAQKAGFYFDHSYNRLKLLHLLHDLNLRELKILDLFCYAGAWGFALIRHGFAKHVHFVDQGDFMKTLAETAICNSIISEKFKFTRDNVFTFFESNNEKYDLIICDPPALAKSNSKISQAIEGYKKLFRQCLLHINNNGILVAASCTHGISLEELSKLIGLEGRKANRVLAILDMGTQRIDHPISSLSGSAFYLKYICYHVS
ncbi:MAG: methyltransferase [Bdellovibrionota bacterium]